MHESTKDNIVFGIAVPSLLVNIPQQFGLFSLDNAQSIVMAFLIGAAGFGGKHASQWLMEKARKKDEVK